MKWITIILLLISLNVQSQVDVDTLSSHYIIVDIYNRKKYSTAWINNQMIYRGDSILYFNNVAHVLNFLYRKGYIFRCVTGSKILMEKKEIQPVQR